MRRAIRRIERHSARVAGRRAAPLLPRPRPAAKCAAPARKPDANDGRRAVQTRSHLFEEAGVPASHRATLRSSLWVAEPRGTRGKLLRLLSIYTANRYYRMSGSCVAFGHGQIA